MLASVRVVYGNSLVFFREISNNTFSKNVEGATKKDIVSVGINDVCLHVKCDRSYFEGHIPMVLFT